MGSARVWLTLVVMLLGTVIGCEGSPPEGVIRPVTYPLPFGLRQVQGTSAVGRPASFEDVLVVFEGEQVRGRRLLATYLVTGDNPERVFLDWVDQLGGLSLDELSVVPGEAELGQWLVATGSSSFRPDEPFGAFAQLQLWRTGAGPVVLLDVSVRPGARPAKPSPAVVPATPRPSTEVPDERRQAGDVLFTEQNQSIHLPTGTRALLPTLPISAGTGGSYSVLQVDDADAVVKALLDEAQSRSDSGEVRGPTTTVEDGVRVLRASFTVPAGGWFFEVVTTMTNSEPTASMIVTSGAD